MPLLPVDEQFLVDRGFDYEVVEEAGMTCLVIKQWRLPGGLSHHLVDVLVRLKPGYPDVAPDMWWVHPAITAEAGRAIPATQHQEHHLGRTWQRWSRHFRSGQWQPGVDRLENFLGLMHSEFARAAGGRAA